MTTNQQRAAEVLGKVRYERSRLATPDMIEWFARDAYREVHALADAGLLMPDPVRPSPYLGSPEWLYLGDQVVATSGDGDIGIQHTTVIHDEDDMPVHAERWIDLTPEDARRLAAILWTAAAHAEKEKK